MISLLYILLAALGLGFLIFIHELGHYLMAKHVGMKVEAFGIGFGKPIYSWERNGVQWRLCWLPFGGYVKIAGMESEEGVDPYEIPNGYFSKKPLDRIKVAFSGPFVNLVFAFLVFIALWAFGGREKNFSEFAPVIGWVDPQSELYAQGVRPGDIITSYNDHQFNSFKDHLYAPMTASDQLAIKGFKVDYLTGEKSPFDYTVKVYPHPSALTADLKTAGILHSASYVIYDKMPSGRDNPLPEGSPLIDSGIAYGDRLFWVDGEVVYSDQELSHILNDHKALLTIQRGNEVLIKRVPRVPVQDLKVDAALKEELIDWQYAAKNNMKMANLFMIPYNITPDNVVENELRFIDSAPKDENFPVIPFSSVESPLKVGDKIIAIDGTPVTYAYQLLDLLQKRQVNIIVERNPEINKNISSDLAGQQFNSEINWKDLAAISSSIGTGKTITDQGQFHLLKAVVPKTRAEFALSPEAQARFAADMLEKKKEISAIPDPDKKNQALRLLEQREKQYILGLPAYQDRKVNYNPSPVELFVNVFDEIWHTLSALIMGYLNPKWISGPLGIVQVVHDSWMISMKEALFWMGAISLNLGMLNLLPIPVLDGGYICLSLFEMATGKRLKPKTLEKLIIPFAVLLIGFLIFLTYNDLMRLIG